MFCFSLSPRPSFTTWFCSGESFSPETLWAISDLMDHNLFETVEQQAIELVSSLGKEHLFVANCPSDIDADKYSGTVITYEETFDHSDAGVGLCLLLPKAFVLQKFVDMSLNKNISGLIVQGTISFWGKAAKLCVAP